MQMQWLFTWAYFPEQIKRAERYFYSQYLFPQQT